MLRKHVAQVFCLAAVSLILSAPNHAQDATNLSVDQIVQRNASVRGGAEAWRAVRSISMIGEMGAGRGVQLPYVLDQKRPLKSRFELEISGKKAIQIFDGTQGFKTRPVSRTTEWEPMTPVELRQAGSETELDGLLIDYQRKGHRLELMGQESVEGRNTYKLEVVMPSGLVRHLWVDSESFLEVKVDSTRRMDGKDRVLETYLRDYRPEAGLLMPHIFETATQGIKERQRLVIRTVFLNPTLEDSLFTRP